jgi:type II secretory pathway component PulF
MRELLGRLQLAWARRTLRRQRSQFYYELGMSLREHVPMVTTLRKYENRARNRGSSMSRVYLEMLLGFQSGSMSMALGKVATPLEQTLMDATQTAGDQAMAQGLQFMAQTVEKTNKMRGAVTKAVAYPLFLFVLFSNMMMAFSFLAVPVLAELMAPERWPPLGRALYLTTEAVRGYGAYLLATLVLLIAMFVYSLSRWTGPWRQKVDAYFPYSVYRDFSGALLLVSLAAMMNAGISLRTSLGRVQKFASPWMAWHIRRVVLNLSRANSPYFGQAFQTGVLNQQMADQVQDASERRNPVEAFIRTGSQAIDQMVVILEKRARLVNVVMMLICGLLLALMFGGFMSTAMSMQTGLREAR